MHPKGYLYLINKHDALSDSVTNNHKPSNEQSEELRLLASKSGSRLNRSEEEQKD